MTALRLALATTATATAVAATATLALAAPSLAATHATSDPRGDATPRRYDITAFHVDNGRHELRLDLTTRGFGRNKVSTLFRIGTPGSNRTQFIVGSAASGHGHRDYLREFTAPSPHGVGVHPVHCPGLDVAFRPAQYRVVVSLPQRCLGESAGTHVFGASTQHPDGQLADITRDLRATRG